MLIVCVLTVLLCYGGWRTYKYYQHKHYMQEHGELMPNTPKDGANMDNVQMPNIQDDMKKLKMPAQAPQ